MKKTNLIAVVIAATLAGTPALAADMAVKARPPAPTPVFSWTGFYAGVNGGYGWGNTSASFTGLDPASTAFINLPVVGGSDQFANSVRQRGAILGGQIGYNWQFSPSWFAGLETDIQWSGVNGEAAHTLLLGFYDAEAERKLEWFGTVRGRLGFLATADLMLYGTGGLAYGETNASGIIQLGTPAGTFSRSNLTAGGFTYTCVADASLLTVPVVSTCYQGSGSRTSVGWAAGAGLEYHLFGNVTAKLEYLHVDLGGQTITLVSPSPPSTPGVATAYKFDSQAVDIVRVGLNYHFQ